MQSRFAPLLNLRLILPVVLVKIQMHARGIKNRVSTNCTK